MALAWIATFFRPEGALQALFVGATLVAFPRKAAWRERARGGLAIVAIAALPLLLWALTGSPQSNTAVAKLLPGNPYFVGSADRARRYQMHQLVGILLDGEVRSAEFLPHRGAPICHGGPRRDRASAAGAGRGGVAPAFCSRADMFAPCFYYSSSGTGFATSGPSRPAGSSGWRASRACSATCSARCAHAGEWSTPLLCGLFAGMLATKIESTHRRRGVVGERHRPPAGRARALGATTCPADARIGLNDTGAIAYFSERQTFDIVGLTTAGEARYWVAGSASRFEHYERLAQAGKLPTHFIVYPDWMGLDRSPRRAR